jgi:hypothetical protein
VRYVDLEISRIPVDKLDTVHYEFKPITAGLLNANRERQTSKMPRTKKKTVGRPPKGRTQDYIDDGTHDESEDEDLPSDEAGRRKIKKNYEDLLGIRIDKLKGRVLNREKINKSIDGLYFICFECKKICHNLDDGWMEEAVTLNNFCGPCAKAKGVRAAPPIT